MTVVLIGPPAAGKTRIGKRLAVRLGRPFIDTDHEIVAEHGPIPQIFAEYGEPHFRLLEREAVSRALSQHAVVSLGGGAVLDPETQADLASASVILLTVKAEAVATRIGNTKRPLVSDLASWQALVDSRAELYASLADYSTDTSTRPLDAVVEEIALWVEGNR